MQYQIERNDITNMQVDAVVIPANKLLQEGNGASTAIYEKAGRQKLVNACKKALMQYGVLHVGTAIYTLGYDLNAKYILHAIVPKWKDGCHKEYEMLCATYLSTLKMADMIGCETVAFPLLSAGNNGFDLELAFKIAQECIDKYEATNKLSMVYIVVYDLRVMDMLRGLKVSVVEKIDEEYILNANYDTIQERIISEGKNRIHMFVDAKRKEAKKKVQEQVDSTKKQVVEYMKDPENREQVYEEAGKILKTVLAALH